MVTLLSELSNKGACCELVIIELLFTEYAPIPRNVANESAADSPNFGCPTRPPNSVPAPLRSFLPSEDCFGFLRLVVDARFATAAANFFWNAAFALVLRLDLLVILRNGNRCLLLANVGNDLCAKCGGVLSASALESALYLNC